MDILGIGNALVDIFCFTDDEISPALGLYPNAAAHVAPERMDELLLAVTRPVPVSGGGASNALKAAAALGSSCAFVGCTGTEDRESDRWARIFERDLAAFGIRAFLERRAVATGRCLVIRMPGGIKAVACAPGAAPTLRPEQIDPVLIADAKIVHLDGQVLRNAELTDRIANLCRSLNVPLSIDIASADIARSRAGLVDSILRNNRCVLFMNEDESHEFSKAIAPTGCEGTLFASYTENGSRKTCIVRKRGAAGAQAWIDGEMIDAPSATAVEAPLDDTAAGDCFAGAFLNRWLAGGEAGPMLETANAFAAAVLGVPGSDIPPPARPAIG